MLDSRPLLLQTDFPPIRRRSLDTLQVNLGYVCNLSCVHCHVNAGPQRTESMPGEMVDMLIEVIDALRPGTLDLTGGAPELNPHFRRLVCAARARGLEVIDRCNLTVLFEPGQEGLAQFLAEQGVTITASLPCYLEENVEQQRGKGVYDDSIRALRLLNTLGYGDDGDDGTGGGVGDGAFRQPHKSAAPRPSEETTGSEAAEGSPEGRKQRQRKAPLTTTPPSSASSDRAFPYVGDPVHAVGSNLQLNLVYNPVGPVLPPPQPQLEADYKRELGERFGIRFNQLFTITNMPIKRFGAVLMSTGQYEGYMGLLRDNYKQDNLDTVMCRSLISVDWQGYIYDCDFNQMLDMPVLAGDRRRHIRDLLAGDSLLGADIATGEHCYGCTAGQGSSCGGALDG